MKWLQIIPRTLWKLLFLVNFLVGLLLLYPLFYFLLLKKESFEDAFRLKRFWANWITFVPGIRVEVENPDNLHKIEGACVYMANHVSYLDIVISYRVIDRLFVFMGKQELQRAPLFNIFFKRMNILVDRASRTGSHRAYMKALQTLERGTSVFIFPEGTIGKEPLHLKPFKNGAFKLAIEKQVPIVPITYLNNWQILQNGGFFKSIGKPGVARVVIHQPIQTQGLNEKDIATLRADIHHTMQTTLDQYYTNRNNPEHANRR